MKLIISALALFFNINSHASSLGVITEGNYTGGATQACLVNSMKYKCMDWDHKWSLNVFVSSEKITWQATRDDGREWNWEATVQFRGVNEFALISEGEVVGFGSCSGSRCKFGARQPAGIGKVRQWDFVMRTKGSKLTIGAYTQYLLPGIPGDVVPVTMAFNGFTEFVH